MSKLGVSMGVCIKGGRGGDPYLWGLVGEECDGDVAVVGAEDDAHGEVI